MTRAPGVTGPAGDTLRASQILVTGGSGFIGRHVVGALREAGARVRVLNLQPFPDASVDTVLGDIADPAIARRAVRGGVDGVVHLAAVTSVLRSLEHPQLTFETNVIGTQNILEAARGAGAQAIVLASSNAVAGPMDEPSISERSTLRPLTPYGATKAAAEMLLSAYTAGYGLRGVSLRLTNVYGPGMQAKDSLVARLMRAILDQTGFEIYGTGRQVRDYVHVFDVVAAVQLGLTDPAWRGPVVIGSGRSLSVLDVLATVRAVSGAELPVVHGPARAGEMPAVIVDNSGARAVGWTPEIRFEDGVAGVWQEWSAAVAEPVGL